MTKPKTAKKLIVNMLRVRAIVSCPCVFGLVGFKPLSGECGIGTSSDNCEQCWLNAIKDLK